MPKRLKGCLSSGSVENVPMEEYRSGRSIEERGYKIPKNLGPAPKENSSPEISRFSSKCSPGYASSVKQKQEMVERTLSQTRESISVSPGSQGVEKGSQTKITALVSNSDVLAKISLPQGSEAKGKDAVPAASEEKVNGEAKVGETEIEQNIVIRPRKTRSLSYSSTARVDDSFGVKELSQLRRSSAPAAHVSRERKPWKREISINEEDSSQQSEEEPTQTPTIVYKENQVDKKTQVSELDIGSKRADTSEKASRRVQDSRAVGGEQRLENIEESEGSSGSSSSDTSESSSDSSDSDDSLEDYGEQCQCQGGEKVLV
ncbi:hypothetical protein EGW08_008451 [Elysia chlorotica]|uniref:Uncharacterized protein n=1 Tax=Elysia chlorotica TaxID=188477 RepID=A0A433TQB5_ELYCH|nr:hypothetical protein EGW08_008451 [Elysia chlorotica]